MRQRQLRARKFGARAVLRQREDAVRLLAEGVGDVVGDDQVEVLALELAAGAFLDVLALRGEADEERLLRARPQAGEDVRRADQPEELLALLLLHFLRSALGGALVGDRGGHDHDADAGDVRVHGAGEIVGRLDVYQVYTWYTGQRDRPGNQGHLRAPIPRRLRHR